MWSSLPDRLEKIGAECVALSGLEELVLPESVREIGAGALSDCYQLRSVQLNEGLQKLGAKEVIDGEEHEGEVFAGSAIESIGLPFTLRRIEARTFFDCRRLGRIEIPDGVEYIGEKCFCASGVAEVTLPSTLKEVGRYAFDGCDRLRVVCVEEGCTLDIRKCVGRPVEVRRK